MAKRNNPSLYRALHHLREGGLHKALHVPLDEDIPEARVERATHSPNPHVEHMARMALTMEGFHHTGKKK